MELTLWRFAEQRMLPPRASPCIQICGDQRERAEKEETPNMYQPIQFKNAATLVALAVLIILPAKTSFAQVDYSTFNYPDVMGGSTFLTGVRGAGGRDLYVTGTFLPQGSSDMQGLLYQGRLSGDRQWTVPNFPSSGGLTVTSTALYGPMVCLPITYVS
jgi:hypothetical protein